MRAVLVLLVDDDEVVWVNLRRDGFGELRGTEDRGEGLQAEVRSQQKSEGSSGEGERGSVWLGPPAQEVRRERAEEEADCGERERQAEEAERLRVEVEEVAHAHGVVAWVLLQQRSQVGIRRRRTRMQQEVDRRRSEDRAKRNQHAGTAKIRAAESV